jgi:hypothetical protein
MPRVIGSSATPRATRTWCPTASSSTPTCPRSPRRSSGWAARSVSRPAAAPGRSASPRESSRDWRCGSGRRSGPGDSRFGYAESNENLVPYGLLQHTHMPEIAETIERIGHADEGPPGIEAPGRLQALLRSRPAAGVQGNEDADPARDLVIAMGVVDNLGKGAAGQAVQNANLICGLPGRTGWCCRPRSAGTRHPIPTCRTDRRRPHGPARRATPRRPGLPGSPARNRAWR